MAWVSLWKRLCQPKSVGGMGFRDIRPFNLALLAKQGWRLLTNPNSVLFKMYKARYFQESSFLAWRGIWTARRYLTMGLRYRVGKGNAYLYGQTRGSQTMAILKLSYLALIIRGFLIRYRT